MAALALPGFAQTSLLGPGKYEATLDVTIAGETQPPVTEHQCFTRADLDGLESWLAGHLGDGCAISDRKADGGRVTFSVTCAEDAGRAATRSEITTDRDAFVASLHRTEDVGGEQLESIYTITARRVGDCPE